MLNVNTMINKIDGKDTNKCPKIGNQSDRFFRNVQDFVT